MLKKKLYANGALYAQMSGSGSTIFGIFGQKPANIKDFSQECSHIVSDSNSNSLDIHDRKSINGL